MSAPADLDAGGRLGVTLGMADDIPQRPARVSREAARGAKQRQKLFLTALKAAARAAGWKAAGGGVFRQQDEWFVSVLPVLLWERGVKAMLLAKPMAIDPLFWRVVGLPENERLPLSFRANGAWVLRPPFRDANIGLGETDPERLADAFVTWAGDHLPAVTAGTPATLLAEIESLGERRRHHATLEICLRLMLDDWSGALALCEGRGPTDFGGYGSGKMTFFDWARDWIAANRPAHDSAASSG
ncbi:MAG: hypothetical protein JO303_14730 [Caulobacteraceae bacterium]|nr:hypothetical protein [Caulobacteraceae bacterium]